MKFYLFILPKKCIIFGFIKGKMQGMCTSRGIQWNLAHWVEYLRKEYSTAWLLGIVTILGPHGPGVVV